MYKEVIGFAKKWLGAAESRITKKMEVSNVGTKEIRDGLYSLFTYELTDLTADVLREYIEQARLGFPFFLYSLFSDIRRKDLKVGTALQRRKLAVLDEEWRIECEDEDMAKFAEMLLNNIMEWDKVLTRLVEANIQGIKLFEINYELKESKILPKEIIAVDSHLYFYNHNVGEYGIIDSTRVTGGDLRSWGISALNEKFNFDTVKKIDVIPEKLLTVKGLDGDEKNAFMNGMTIAFILAYFYKVYNVKDLAIYIERFASPTVDAVYDPLNQDSKKQMEAAIGNLKAFGGIVRPVGSELTLLADSERGTASEIFLKSIAYWDKGMTERALGESETTDMGGVGSYAALKVKKYVSDDISTGDLKVIQEAINNVIERTVKMNFASVKEMPVFKFVKIKTLEDKKTQSEIVNTLNAAGYKMKREIVEEEFDTELEEPVEPKEPVEPVEPSEPKEKDGFEDYAEAYIRTMQRTLERR